MDLSAALVAFFVLLSFPCAYGSDGIPFILSCLGGAVLAMGVLLFALLKGVLSPQSKKRLYFACVVVFCACALLLAAVYCNLVVLGNGLCALGAVLAAATAIMFIFAGVALQKQEENKFLLSLAVAGIVSALFVFLLSVVEGALFVIAVVVAVAIVAVAAFTMRGDVDDIARVSGEKNQRIDRFKTISISACLFGLIFGLSLFVQVETSRGVVFVTQLIAAAFAIAAAAFILISSRYLRQSIYRLPQVAFFLISICLFLLMILLPPSFAFYVGVAFDILLVIRSFTTFYIVAELGKRDERNAFTAFCFNRGMEIFGILLGFGLSTLLSMFLSADLSLNIIAALGCMVAAICLTLIFRLDFNLWVDIVEAENQEEPELPKEADVEGKKNTSAWKASCQEIADQYHLSEREKDVLLLLSRGRTTKYIEQELVVSYSTAKTHVYHIYSKLGIHSQQELIDIVEECYAKHKK